MKVEIQSSNSIIKLIEIFKVLKNLNTYCSIICKENELFIQTMDDSHVCLFELIIYKDWFHSYENSNETISFNTIILIKILNLYTKNSKVFIETTNSDKLQVTIESSDNIIKDFEIPLIDIDKDILSTQELDCNLEFSMNTKKFEKYINELSLFGENMEIICCDDNIFMKSYGDEGKYSVKIPHENLDNFIVDEDLKLKTKLSIKYLSYINKISSVFKDIKIGIQKNAPIYLEIIEENEEKKKLITIKYYIAPKVEDDEDDNENFDDYENKVI